MTPRATLGGRVALLSRRGYRSVRLLAAVLVACCVGPFATVADAASPPVLTRDVTVTAPATGYLRVRVARPLDLDPFGVKPPVTFSGTGPVGMALVPDRIGTLHRNIVLVRTRTPNGEELVVSPAIGVDPVTGAQYGRYLRPGIYRLFLLTRGGGSVRLRLPEQPPGARSFRAAARVPWAFHESTAAPDATGRAPVTREATLDFDGKQPGYVFGSQWVHAAVSAATVQDACFYRGRDGTSRQVPMCAQGDYRGPLVRPGPEENRVSRLWVGAIYPEPPGPQSLRVCYLNAGDVRGAGALLFFLPAAA